MAMYTVKLICILFPISIEEEEETELRQKEVMHIHRIYSKSIRAAPIDILIRESESKGSLDRPDVVHRKRVRELKLTARSSHASNENDDIDFNCGTQKSVRVKVRRSKRKRKHHHHMFVPPYPLFMPHLHAPPMYTYAPTTCTYTPTMYPCFPPAHAHNSCYICN